MIEWNLNTLISNEAYNTKPVKWIYLHHTTQSNQITISIYQSAYTSSSYFFHFSTINQIWMILIHNGTLKSSISTSFRVGPLALPRSLTLICSCGRWARRWDLNRHEKRVISFGETIMWILHELLETANISRNFESFTLVFFQIRGHSSLPIWNYLFEARVVKRCYSSPSCLWCIQKALCLVIRLRVARSEVNSNE